MSDAEEKLTPAVTREQMKAFCRARNKLSTDAEAENFADCVTDFLASVSGATTAPTLQTDTCPPRRCDSAGIGGERQSLPSVGPGAVDREKLADWFENRAEFDTREQSLGEADALIASGLLSTKGEG